MIDWATFSLKDLAGLLSSVKDRLASFYHWNDKQSLEQAINICLDQKINLADVKLWSINEAQEEKFELFLQALRSRMVIGQTQPPLKCEGSGQLQNG
jgi:hypothetical protein